MSKTRPKPAWWNWKTYGGLGAVERRINRKGMRRSREREATRDIKEETQG